MKRQGSMGLAIACDDPLAVSGSGQCFDPQGSSLQFTDNGSMLYKGYKIGDKGVQTSPDGPGPTSGLSHALQAHIFISPTPTCLVGCVARGFPDSMTIAQLVVCGSAHLSTVYSAQCLCRAAAAWQTCKSSTSSTVSDLGAWHRHHDGGHYV